LSTSEIRRNIKRVKISVLKSITPLSGLIT